MAHAYTLARFIHFLGLLLWVSGLFVVLKSARIFLRLQARDAYTQGEVLPVLRPAYIFASHLGMALAWLGGLTMLYYNQPVVQQGWMRAKLLLLLALSAITCMEYRLAQRWSAGENLRIPWWMRLVDGLLILIVALAVFRPF